MLPLLFYEAFQLRKIVETWKKKIKRTARKRAEELIRVASKSVGRTSWNPRPACKTCWQNMIYTDNNMKDWNN